MSLRVCGLVFSSRQLLCAPVLVALGAGCGGSGSADAAGGANGMKLSVDSGGSGATAGNGAGAGHGGAAAAGGSLAASAGVGGSAAGMSGATGGAGGADGMASAGLGGSAPSAGASGMLGASGTAGASAAGASGASGSGSLPTGSLDVTNLKIEPNPKMTLSCYVSWTTSEAASSEVQFGTEGYHFHVVDSTLATDHKVHVVGMHPETAYQIKAVSTSQTATGSAEGTFTTGKLPTGLPNKLTLVANTPDKMQPGWTLTNLFPGGSAPATIAMIDEEGIPVWYFVHGKTADQFGMTSTVWLSNGHVLVGNASQEPAREVNLEGNILWEGPTGGTPAASHHTSKLSTGHYLIVRESNASARVEELDADDNVVWSWDLYDHIKPKTTAADWCHLNSVSVDEAKDILFFNCRFQGLFGVKRSDKSILWQLGAAIDDSNSGDVTYLPDNSARFNDSHDPEVHTDDGTVLFYDNQGWSSHTGGEGNGSYHTRVVEYQFDQTKKEATLSWQFPGSFTVNSWYTQKWATPIWGDANRLANGNVLITAGSKSTDTNTRIFEVTRAGEVVWGFEWPNGDGAYRANRISPAPATKLP